MSAPTPLDQAYKNCEQIARQSNFYAGLRVLPAHKRRALLAIYAFMRQSDDISDDENTQTPEAQFHNLRRLFDEALKGNHREHPTLPALRDAVSGFEIPPELFHQLMDGTERDLIHQGYATFEELYHYCYHVASVVGLICLHVFGSSDPSAPERAIACGIAFQLTNILRDIREDLDRDRIYLPLEDLNRFGYSVDDLRKGIYDERFQALMTFEIKRARDFYDQGRGLLKIIERDSRPCFWAMFRFYESILVGVEKSGTAFLTSRIRLSKLQKFRLILEAAAQRWAG
jgi:phytoene synthase